MRLIDFQRGMSRVGLVDRDSKHYKTVSDFMSLPGVVAVEAATPDVGEATIIVEAWAEGLCAKLVDNDQTTLGVIFHEQVEPE